MTTTIAERKDVAREMLADEVRAALADGRRIRLAGAGTWLDAGRPVESDAVVSTRELRGIVEYVPGDLTLTARAGTSLAEIREATAAHGQWLALDPHGSDEGTLGATVATASAGPLAAAFGTPRDLVLGLEFISGTGAVVRGGGRVVKNVAGFDLVRLLTGSWGTLGLITEITVRLHARPQADESFAVPIGADDIDGVRRFLRGLPFPLYACEAVNAPLAAALHLGADAAVLARAAGNSELVSAARSGLRELGAPRAVGAEVWENLRRVEPRDAAVLRLSHLPTRLGEIWRAAAASGGDALMHATPTRGLVRCILRDARVSAAAIEHVTQAVPGVTLVGERLPADAWSRIPTPAAGRLSPGIKRAFDPGHQLNRAILGEQS